MSDTMNYCPGRLERRPPLPTLMHYHWPAALQPQSFLYLNLNCGQQNCSYPPPMDWGSTNDSIQYYSRDLQKVVIPPCWLCNKVSGWHNLTFGRVISQKSVSVLGCLRGLLSLYEYPLVQQSYQQDPLSKQSRDPLPKQSNQQPPSNCDLTINNNRSGFLQYAPSLSDDLFFPFVLEVFGVLLLTLDQFLQSCATLVVESHPFPLFQWLQSSFGNRLRWHFSRHRHSLVRGGRRLWVFGQLNRSYSRILR